MEPCAKGLADWGAMALESLGTSLPAHVPDDAGAFPFKTWGSAASALCDGLCITSELLQGLDKLAEREILCERPLSSGPLVPNKADIGDPCVAPCAKGLEGWGAMAAESLGISLPISDDAGAFPVKT